MGFIVALVLLLAFPALAKGGTCNVLDFGALGDGQTDDTKAIQSAIDDTSCDVVLVQGSLDYVSGPLFLRSNLVLTIDGNIIGSSDVKGWPVIYTRRAGIMEYTYASLINGGTCNKMKCPLHRSFFGDNCKEWNRLSNVTVNGGGVVDGNAEAWVDYDSRRPTMLGLGWIDDLTLTDVKLVNPAFWCTHVLFCNDVYIARLSIDTTGSATSNGDGIDPDSSSNVLIEDCSISSDDDVIAIKSGKDRDGRAVGIPSDGIVIRNMQFKQGHGVSIGSETSGGISNVHIYNIEMDGTDRGVRIKSEKGRGSYVKNIMYENITLNNVETGISITMKYSSDACGPAPTFQNITVRNLQGASNINQAGEIDCLKESPCTDLVFDSVDLSIAATGWENCQYAYGNQTYVTPEIPCLQS